MKTFAEHCLAEYIEYQRTDTDHMYDEFMETNNIDPVVMQNINMLHDRSQFGIKKYGTDLTRQDLSTHQKLKHLLEELLDAANYIQSELHNSK